MENVIVFSEFFIVLLIAVFFFSWYRLRQSLFAGSYPRHETPGAYHLTFQTRRFKVRDGSELEGWYIPAKNPKAVIIMVHGYRDTKGTIIEHAKYLHDAGYTTFFMDFRSDSPIMKVTLGIEEYKDVEAAYDYMRSLPENKNKPIGLFGGSMGASTSIIAAGKTGKGDFIIASVPYANFKSLMEQRIRLENLPQILLPFARIANAMELGWRYENFTPDKYIKKISVPIFLISSLDDEKVNPNDARHLYNLANHPKHYWEAKAQHDIYKDIPQEYERHILSFLHKALKRNLLYLDRGQ